MLSPVVFQGEVGLGPELRRPPKAAAKSAEKKREQEQDDEDEENDLGDTCSGPGDSAKSERGCNQRYYQQRYDKA
jgi:hypothetical protein